MDIISVGDCSEDHFIKLDRCRLLSGKAGQKYLALDFAEKIAATEFCDFVGGNAANVAVALRRLGLKSGIFSVVGNDLVGRKIFEHIKKAKVDIRFLHRDNSLRSDQSAVIVTGGERTILSFHSPKRYAFPRRLDVPWVYLTSLGLGFEPVYREVAAGAKSRKFLVAFNPGTRQLQHSRPQVIKMLKITKLLFVNLQEAQDILRKKTFDPKVLLTGLRTLGAKIAVITDGRRGAYASDGRSAFFVPAFPAIRRDATGAGDAFASGFTAAFIAGLPISEALRWGSVNSASEISQIGVQNGLLTKNVLVKKLNTHASFKSKVLR